MTAKTLLIACALITMPVAVLHAGELETGVDTESAPTEAVPGETASPEGAAPAEAPIASGPPAAAAVPAQGADAPGVPASEPIVAAPEPVAAAPIVADPAITQSDPETEKKLANVRVVTVRNLDWRELTPGMAIYEQGGKLIGHVVSVSGTDVIVDGAQAQIRVPLVALYGYNVGGVDYVASRVTRADLQKGG